MPVPFSTICKIITDDGCTIRCRTIGNSMFPLIRSGDIIEIKPISTNEIMRNNIIAFRSDNFVIAHRVKRILYEKGERVFFVKGDSYFGLAKQKAMAIQILGKVVSIQSSTKRKIVVSNWPIGQLTSAISHFSPFIYSLFRVITKIKNIPYKFINKSKS